jgi:hypothetical protein
MLTKFMKFASLLIALGWLLAGAASVLPIIFLPMLFDAPGSDSNPGAIAFALGMLGFPLVCVVSAVTSLGARGRDQLRKAFLLLLIPLAHIGLLWAASVWMDHVTSERSQRADSLELDVVDPGRV